MERWMKFHSMTFSNGEKYPYQDNKEEAEKDNGTWNMKT